MNIKELIIKDLKGEFLTPDEREIIGYINEAVEYLSSDDYHYEKIAFEQSEQGKFTKAELKGREIVNESFINCPRVKGHYFTTDQYDAVDVVFVSGTTSGNVECLGEIKYREGYKSTNRLITNEGVLLEEKKLKGIKQKQKDNQPIVYISLFDDGVGYWFDLTDVDFNVLGSKIMYCNKTTVGNDNHKIPKRCYTLPLQMGKRFKFNTDILCQECFA